MSSAFTLVTGGTGFLGRRLVARLLAQGRAVAVLGRTPAPDLEAQGVRFLRASLDDAAAVRAACAGAETIFHVAAKVGVWGRYEDFFRSNVLGTRALLTGAREHGVRHFVHTSTPSVVYNGRDLAGADETLPLTEACPSPYPLTKAIAEREVLAAHSDALRTVALRPHLIWGVGDPHLVPRLLARARAGRLRIVGDGKNRVDMVHVENAVDAHLLAESALKNWNAICGKLLPAIDLLGQQLPEKTPSIQCHLISDKMPDSIGEVSSNDCHVLSDIGLGSQGEVISPASAPASAPAPVSAPAPAQVPPSPSSPVPAGAAGGRAYFVTNGEPVVLWEWINALLTALGEPPVTRRVSLRTASAAGALCEALWRVFPLMGEPPMTRFIAAELAKDHWFSIDAARRDLGYTPRISMAAGTAELVQNLKTGR